MSIDLNCDLGESFGRYELGEDEAVMGFITSVNVACGLHAGDPVVIERTVRLAARLGLAVGAHPGYPDLQGFGRREMNMTPEEVEAFILYQVGAVWAFARAAGIELAHIKPHGALYNLAARDKILAEAIARGARRFSAEIILVGMAGSALTAAGESLGLRVAHEAFPDRAYEPDGSLRSRRLAGALLTTPEEITAHALQLARDGITVISRGEQRVVPVDTLCIHGDHAGAAQNAEMARAALEENGILVESLLKSIGASESREDFMRKHYALVFSPEEKNEVMRMTCMVLWRILHDQSESLEVSPRNLRWFRKGRSFREFPMLGSWPVTFLEVIERLLQRNPALREHFKLIADKGYSRTYQVIG